MYFIEQEIAEQPQVIAHLIAEGTPLAQKIAAAIRDFNPAFAVIAARGTSDNAGRYAQYLMGVHARLSVALATPSIHTIYGATPNLSRALVIGISQSGRAEDVRQVLADAKAQGALTVSITNNPESALAQEAAFHLPLMAGDEVSVAATKTYTTELTAVAMLVKALVSGFDADDHLRALPGYVQQTLDRAASIDQWAMRYRYMDRFASIGRGYNYCTAFEVSLKIKELCYVTGVEYSEADFRHGPIALVRPDFPVIVIAPTGKTLPAMIDLLGKLREKQAECLVISNDRAALDYAISPMSIPDLPEWLSPVVAVVPGQVLAMRLALTKGHSVDKPIGLTKVTVTV
jgi:glucosamine--fructose-6-phosphate aminotransferase (isomerizing)